MDEQRRRYQRKIDLIRKEKTGYMNNTKWSEIINAISLNAQFDLSAKVKLLAYDQVYPFSLNAGVNKSRTGTNDGSVMGPVAFKDIEWVCFYSSVIDNNSIIKLKSLLDMLGKFQYDFDEKSIKLYGYK